MGEEKIAAVAEHIAEAIAIAKTVIDNYNPKQQNEMLKHIRQIVAEKRHIEMEQAEKRFLHLKESLQNL